MHGTSHHAPFNPLPWVVWALALPLIAMELAFAIGASGLVQGIDGAGWRGLAVQVFAYSPAFAEVSWQQGGWLPQEPWRLVTYTLVHASVTNALFAGVLLLAVGKVVAEVMRWWAVLVIWLAAAVAGALVLTLVERIWLAPAPPMTLIGAFPAVYGLFGAFTWIAWMQLGALGAGRGRAFSLVAFLLGADVLLSLVFGAGHGWIADLAGCAAGFLLSFVVGPGGARRLHAAIRRR